MSKKSRSEANKVSMAIKANKSEYYVADVDLDDNVEDVKAACKNIRKILGKTEAGYLIISAGIKNLIVISDTQNKNLHAKDWVDASVKTFTENVTGDENYSEVCVEIDTPFKLKDAVRGVAFNYLRKNNLIEEESEEDEYYEF